ncbi:Inosine-5'-monophosphate dehydrogenase [Symbiodinium microadriaticum]|uniref:Inosine-5'-monophosphate dehydrogenase n=1 Tax=Symbiodinium microadriaticum TaxID=2951 RepID=A0A1Q9DG78_SYMMI|nr:Inosine-5'-monophosphate dehydrogenase [Symbiodinium microadriaticum]
MVSCSTLRPLRFHVKVILTLLRRGETSEEPWQRGLTPAPPNDDTDKLYAHVVIMFSDGACIAWAGERSQSLKEPLPLVEWPFLVVLFRGGQFCIMRCQFVEGFLAGMSPSMAGKAAVFATLCPGEGEAIDLADFLSQKGLSRKAFAEGAKALGYPGADVRVIRSISAREFLKLLEFRAEDVLRNLEALKRFVDTMLGGFLLSIDACFAKFVEREPEPRARSAGFACLVAFSVELLHRWNAQTDLCDEADLKMLFLFLHEMPGRQAGHSKQTDVRRMHTAWLRRALAKGSLQMSLQSQVFSSVYTMVTNVILLCGRIRARRILRRDKDGRRIPAGRPASASMLAPVRHKPVGEARGPADHDGTMEHSRKYNQRSACLYYVYYHGYDYPEEERPNTLQSRLRRCEVGERMRDVKFDSEIVPVSPKCTRPGEHMADPASDGWPAGKVFEAAPQGFTYDDLMFMPQPSSFEASDVDLSSYITKNIRPIIGSPSDTVTDSNMAIALALSGAMGIIHANQDIQRQVSMVQAVKRFVSGFVLEPVVMRPTQTLADLDKLKVPITDTGGLGGELLGIVTARDADLCADRREYLSRVMTERVVTAREPLSFEEALDTLKRAKVGKLLILNSDDQLVSMVTRSDLKKVRDFPDMSRDLSGKLLVGAAVPALPDGSQAGANVLYLFGDGVDEQLSLPSSQQPVAMHREIEHELIQWLHLLQLQSDEAKTALTKPQEVSRRDPTGRGAELCIEVRLKPCMGTPGRRWLWPCCRLGWDEDHEFGLPLEATFLACVASLEKGELFHSAVSPRDCGSVEGNAEVTTHAAGSSAPRYAGHKAEVILADSWGWVEEFGKGWQTALRKGLRMSAQLGLVAQNRRLGAGRSKDLPQVWVFPHVPHGWGPQKVTAVIEQAYDDIVLINHRRSGKQLCEGSVSDRELKWLSGRKLTDYSHRGPALEKLKDAHSTIGDAFKAYLDLAANEIKADTGTGSDAVVPEDVVHMQARLPGILRWGEIPALWQRSLLSMAWRAGTRTIARAPRVLTGQVLGRALDVYWMADWSALSCLNRELTAEEEWHEGISLAELAEVRSRGTCRSDGNDRTRVYLMGEEHRDHLERLENRVEERGSSHCDVGVYAIVSESPALQVDAADDAEDQIPFSMELLAADELLLAFASVPRPPRHLRILADCEAVCTAICCPASCGHRALAMQVQQSGKVARLRGTQWSLVFWVPSHGKHAKWVPDTPLTATTAVAPADDTANRLCRSRFERNSWWEALAEASAAEQKAVRFAATAASRLESHLCTNLDFPAAQSTCRGHSHNIPQQISAVQSKVLSHVLAMGSWEKVDEEKTCQLMERGWFVVEDFLKDDVAKSLRKEALRASTAGKLLPHRFQFSTGTFTKPHIYEADLHNESLQEELPAFAELLFDDSLRMRIDELLPDLKLERGHRSKTVKLQQNTGRGGCFPCHYDNAGPPSNRSITCLVYLNPQWVVGDGGELVLMPFLMPQVVIAPVMNRAVFFRSDMVLHAVRPASAERLCFTIWFDGATNDDCDCNLTVKLLRTELDAARVLKQSPVQRAVSRAVYAQEYEDTLVACMSGTAGQAEMLHAHRQHVAQQMKHPQLGPFIQFLRSLRVAETIIWDHPASAAQDGEHRRRSTEGGMMVPPQPVQRFFSARADVTSKAAPVTWLPAQVVTSTSTPATMTPATLTPNSPFNPSFYPTPATPYSGASILQSSLGIATPAMCSPPPWHARQGRIAATFPEEPILMPPAPTQAFTCANAALPSRSSWQRSMAPGHDAQASLPTQLRSAIQQEMEHHIALQLEAATATSPKVKVQAPGSRRSESPRMRMPSAHGYPTPRASWSKCTKHSQLEWTSFQLPAQTEAQSPRMRDRRSLCERAGLDTTPLSSPFGSSRRVREMSPRGTGYQELAQKQLAEKLPWHDAQMVSCEVYRQSGWAMSGNFHFVLKNLTTLQAYPLADQRSPLDLTQCWSQHRTRQKETC